MGSAPHCMSMVHPERDPVASSRGISFERFGRGFHNRSMVDHHRCGDENTALDALGHT